MFKSGFKNRYRDVQIIGDCMREWIPDTRGSVCITPLYKCSAWSWNVQYVVTAWSNNKHMQLHRNRFWLATLRFVATYVDIILHRGRFWAKSAASGSVRWCCFRSCWTVLSHVMRGRPSCLLQSAGGEANRILLASALSSMRIICPNKVSRRDWIIAEFGLHC